MIKQALIISHGQPSDPDPAEAALALLAAKVAALLPDWRVDSATMAKTGALDAAVRAGVVREAACARSLCRRDPDGQGTIVREHCAAVLVGPGGDSDTEAREPEGR